MFKKLLKSDFFEKSLKVIIYIVAILFGVGVVAALIVIIWQSPERGQTLIEVLRVFPSWPLIILVLGLVAFTRFRKEIAEYISKAKIETPVMTIQPTLQQQSSTGQDENLSQALEKEKSLQQTIEKLLTQQQSTQKDKEAIQDYAAGAISNLVQERDYWKFEYLDNFLVPATKYVLNIASANLTFNRLALTFVVVSWGLPSAQIEVIDSTLRANGLISGESGKIDVTETGKRFLEHYKSKYGFYPPAQASPLGTLGKALTMDEIIKARPEDFGLPGSTEAKE